MLFIFLLALILFGPKRLPEIAREVGKFMAEFRRASNDFKYQLQAEIDKASTPAPTQASPAAPVIDAARANAAPVVLPQAESAPAPQSGTVNAESEHERLMRTARLAFEAQNFTLRPPEPPPIPQTQAAAEKSPAPAPAQSATEPAPAGNSAVQQS